MSRIMDMRIHACVRASGHPGVRVSTLLSVLVLLHACTCAHIHACIHAYIQFNVMYICYYELAWVQLLKGVFKLVLGCKKGCRLYTPFKRGVAIA